MDLYDLREEYMAQSLNESDVLDSPIEQFKIWFGEAAVAKIYEPNAVILATSSKIGIPSARVVLLKAISEKGFDFFTNFQSRKGTQLLENPNAAMVFYWAELERQVRIEGQVDKLTNEESDKYFETRPVGSRLGAWASPQSRVITDRDWLEENHNQIREKFKHGQVPRPENWGGYRLKPHLVEFWQGRQNRLHDRIEYIIEDDDWKIRRLAP